MPTVAFTYDVRLPRLNALLGVWEALSTLPLYPDFLKVTT